MLLTLSRYIALVFAVGLGIGEAVINWGHWQYAPLWIVDYVCVAWLLAGVYLTRNGQSIAVLISAWAFTAGVFSMALSISLDPEIAKFANPDRTILTLIGLMLFMAMFGLIASSLALWKSKP